MAAVTYEVTSDRIRPLCHADEEGRANMDFMLRRKHARVYIPADALAADTANHVLMVAEKDIRLKAVSITACAVVTEDAANYAILDLNKEDGAAGGLTSIDSTNTKTGEGGTLAARVPRSYTIADTDTLDEGEILVLEKTKAATGVVVEPLLVDIEYELV